MGQVCRFAFVLALLASLSLSFGQASPKPAASTAPAPPAFEKKQIAELLAQLTSNDDGQISTATIEIQAVIGKNKLKGFQSLTADFLPALLKAEKYEVADELAKSGILAVPYDARDLPAAFNARIQAAQARKEPEEALKLAHSLFNVCTMKDTAAALVTLAACLKAAYPDKPELVDQLKQQIRGTPASGQATTDSIIKTLPVDNEDAYLLAMNRIPNTNKLRHLSSGNLLLIAGHALEARKEFEAGIATPVDAQYVKLCQEGVACSMKAEDGLLTRANAYMLSATKAPTVVQDLP